MNPQPGSYPNAQGGTHYWDGKQWIPHALSSPTYEEPPHVPTSALAVTSDPPAQQVPQIPSYGQPSMPSPIQPVVFPYAPPVAQVSVHHSSRTAPGIAVAGFVVGLVSIFLPLVFGVAAGITGLILSIVGYSTANRTQRAAGLAVAGIVLSSVGIIFIL